MDSFGCVYLAFGPVYNDATQWSIQSLLDTGFEGEICVFTDNPSRYQEGVETRQIEHRVHHPGDSILNNHHIVFDKNLYVDADVVWIRNPEPIFELLDVDDLVVETLFSGNVSESLVPEAFPVMSTTAFGYTSSDEIRNLFETWNNRKREYKTTKMNRFAFTDAIFECDLKFTPLSQEFMSRIKGPAMVPPNVMSLHYQDIPRETVIKYRELLKKFDTAVYARIESGNVIMESHYKHVNMHQFGTYISMMRRDMVRIFEKIQARFMWD